MSPFIGTPYQSPFCDFMALPPEENEFDPSLAPKQMSATDKVDITHWWNENSIAPDTKSLNQIFQDSGMCLYLACLFL